MSPCLAVINVSAKMFQILNWFAKLFLRRIESQKLHLDHAGAAKLDEVMYGPFTGVQIVLIAHFNHPVAALHQEARRLIDNVIRARDRRQIPMDEAHVLVRQRATHAAVAASLNLLCASKHLDEGIVLQEALGLFVYGQLEKVATIQPENARVLVGHKPYQRRGVALNVKGANFKADKCFCREVPHASENRAYVVECESDVVYIVTVVDGLGIVAVHVWLIVQLG